MKLLDKYSRLNITATILTFVVGSCTFYFLLNFILVRELDERLMAERQEILAYVRAHNILPDIVRTKDQFTEYQRCAAPSNTVFLSVRAMGAKDMDDFREIRFSVAVADKFFLVTVGTPLEETESLLQVIIGVTLAMVAAILLIGFLINRIVIRRLWQPFYDTIARMKDYHLADQDALKLAATPIEEFTLLNQSINEMVERIQRDYGSLKNFTSQAAHEMQTPLAVIRTKLDTLMQQESLLEKNARHIMDIEMAVHRLSRLHQSLLLLTRVENRQFILNETIQIDRIVDQKCGEYAEMAASMHLGIKVRLQPMTLLFHHHLAEIVVSNLLNNATRYNREGGSIEITLDEQALTVANTSGNAALDTTRLFKRFYRDSTTSEGTGLGLSIVKQICDIAGYTIEYDYVDGWHVFRIKFDQNRF